MRDPISFCILSFQGMPHAFYISIPSIRLEYIIYLLLFLYIFFSREVFNVVFGNHLQFCVTTWHDQT